MLRAEPARRVHREPDGGGRVAGADRPDAGGPRLQKSARAEILYFFMNNDRAAVRQRQGAAGRQLRHQPQRPPARVGRPEPGRGRPIRSCRRPCPAGRTPTSTRWPAIRPRPSSCSRNPADAADQDHDQDEQRPGRLQGSLQAIQAQLKDVGIEAEIETMINSSLYAEITIAGRQGAGRPGHVVAGLSRPGQFHRHAAGRVAHHRRP